MPDDPRASRSGTPPSPPTVVDGSRPPGARRLADDLWMESEPVRDRVRVRVYGEIDLDIAGAFHDALDEALRASRTGLDLDLSAVTFCNSTGLNTLLRLRLAARGSGRDVVVTAVSAPVERLLAVTDTGGLFAPGGGGGAGRPGGDETGSP
ncbi:STAS domain-containing protein [Kitasatospora sp. NPDC059327]|uniref:STAS domain-containing protein n=1 Tax=Kitasatospora sp. NPDC059327 TaxID=3346803 RepID=UPI0036787E5F